MSTRKNSPSKASSAPDAASLAAQAAEPVQTDSLQPAPDRPVAGPVQPPAQANSAAPAKRRATRKTETTEDLDQTQGLGTDPGADAAGRDQTPASWSTDLPADALTDESTTLGQGEGDVILAQAGATPPRPDQCGQCGRCECLNRWCLGGGQRRSQRVRVAGGGCFCDFDCRGSERSQSRQERRSGQHRGQWLCHAGSGADSGHADRH